MRMPLVAARGLSPRTIRMGCGKGPVPTDDPSSVSAGVCPLAESKQRVTQWFNARHGHVGTLWTGRFKSVLLEDGARVRAVANYIHANPVRAGIVEDAREYEWSSLGAAARGDIFAARGLALIGLRPDAESSRMAGECPARDLRLSNAVVAGSRAYVKRMASRFGGLLSGRAARMAHFAMCGIEFFSTHGQRSRPKNAA